MKKMNLIAGLAFVAAVGFPSASMAEETVTEKVQNAGNKAVDNTKEAGRNVSDKVCEMVNGKMKCVAKKVKHSAQNMADDVETKAKEVKNKVD